MGKNTHLTGPELAFIRANWSKLTIKDISQAMGRSRDAVSRYMRDQNVRPVKCYNGKKMPKGAVSIMRVNGKKIPMIKVDDKFIPLKIYVWRELIGDIPKGYCISHRDGDEYNCEPSNLVIVSKRKWMQRNSINNYPPELREVIKLASRLKHSIDEQSKNSEGSAVFPADSTQSERPSGEQRKAS